jgi:PAS domain S-box-containing protein
MDLRNIAFEHAPIGLAILKHRKIQDCNHMFCDMFGGDLDRLRLASIEILYPTHDDFERTGEIVRDALSKHGSYHDERIMRRLDGTLFWCRVRGHSTQPDPSEQAIWSFADLSQERPVVSLTPREKEIAILTCRGLTSKEIGRELGVSYRTIEVHRAKLLTKFNARKLHDLVAKLSGMPL